MTITKWINTIRLIIEEDRSNNIGEIFRIAERTVRGMATPEDYQFVRSLYETPELDEELLKMVYRHVREDKEKLAMIVEDLTNRYDPFDYFEYPKESLVYRLSLQVSNHPGVNSSLAGMVFSDLLRTLQNDDPFKDIKEKTE